MRTLVSGGLLQLLPNTDHARSPLLAATDEGSSTFQALAKRQAVWVNDLADGLSQADLDAASRVLEAVCERLDADHSTHG
ncbi:MAG TPA: hypothetical protein VF423_09890 [Actinomycetes bacterium]